MGDKYVHLSGTESVERAGRNMIAAAESMHRTQGYMDESLRHFLTRFEELVCRLEAALTTPNAEEPADVHD